MSDASGEPPRDTVSVHVENLGGIAETDVELVRGVNVLTGRNATNRTSFLRSIMAAMGSDDVSLRGGAESGRVDLSVGDETFTRVLRRNGSVTVTGEPYLEDPTVADTFAFLLESNPARRAVAVGGDLREVVMRPVDTDEIEAEVERLGSEKAEIDAALDRRDAVEARLDELLGDRDQVEGRLDAAREELTKATEAIDNADADLDERREEQAALEDTLSELHERRSDREAVRVRLENRREALAGLRSDRSTLEERFGDLPETVGEEVAALDGRIEHLRGRKRDLDAVVNQLQGIIQFNRGMLEGDGSDGLLPTGLESATGSVTDALVPAEEALVCWTCGSETERDQIEETIRRLRGRHQELVDRRRLVADDLEAATDRRESLSEVIQERESRETEHRRLEEEIEEAESVIGRLEGRREELDAEIDRLATEVDELRAEDRSAIVDLHARANELEFEIDRLETRRERLNERVERTRDELDELDSLYDRRREVADALEAARNKIRRVEEDVVAAFNDHAETVLSVLGYENVERIWLERSVEPDGDQRAFPESTLHLHVVRTADSGSAYEDVVDNLSESEREVTGLVFALAGYLVHEVYDAVPFVLLDSLEAIDAERIGAVVEYFADFAPYLVVALLPEDAAAVDTRHHRIESI